MVKVLDTVFLPPKTEKELRLAFSLLRDRLTTYIL